jgi:SAM-dependent methyltransferase
VSVQDAGPFITSDEAALRELARALRAAGYRFVTVTPATHARVNGRPGNKWARSLRDIFGWSRPFRRDVLPPALFELAQRAGILESHASGWRSLVRLSSLDDELFLHSAYPTDDVDSVFFGPDTGRLVDAVVLHLAGRGGPIRRAVDIGCGTGAGAIAIAKRARNAEVLGVDINPAALRATGLNASLAGVANVTVHASDMLRDVDGEFDLIVSNPPFMIDRAERAYRHGGGPLGAGLALSCVDAAIARLAPGGSLVLFTGAIVIDGEVPFLAEAASRLNPAGLVWSSRETDPDVYGEELDGPAYAEADRIALLVLTASRPHSAHRPLDQ